MTRAAMVGRLAGAISVLDEYGYDTVVYNAESPAQRDRHVRMLMSEHRADGAVIVSMDLSRGQVADFARARIPLSMVESSAPGIPSLVIVDIAGGRMATDHLLALGAEGWPFSAIPQRPACGRRRARGGCSAIDGPSPRRASPSIRPCS
jgi:DNA-binding LacI/PurR family transcriptional regulator